jgi:hypothetical protein
MAETAKTSIINLAIQEGHTESYGALLHLVAVMGTDPNALGPETEEERTAWGHHFDGLRAALLCLTMHELKLVPDSAALVVDRLIKSAIDELDRHGGIGTGE